MREELALKEKTTVELWQEIQALRNDFQTHNHLDIGGAQLLTGAMKGITQSSNFLSGSTGCQINWATGIISAVGIQLVGGIIDGTSTIGGRTASTLASAINASGHFIDARLDTSAKEILGDFTFGASGAIKMITNADNGLWISPTGILGKKAGVNTFSIGINGDADFRGTLTGASGTFGTITAGTFTGCLFQTASSGKRAILASSDNSLRFYDTAGQVIGIGTEAGTGMRLDLNATTDKGVRIHSAVSGTGFYYENTGAVVNRGLYLIQSGVANNNLPVVDLRNAGSGELLYGVMTGTGYGIQIARNAGTGTSALIKLYDSVATNGRSLLIQKTHTTGTGTMVEFENDDRGIALSVANANSLSANPTVKIITASSSASSPSLLIDKNGSQHAVEIDQDANDGGNTIGMKMSIVNAGGGTEYAFEFSGSEYDGTKTGVSGLTGVIKILTSDGTVYLPVYNTAT